MTRRRGAVCATAVVLALAGVAGTAGPMALTATAATASSSVVGLRLGDRGPGVTAVQQRLTSHGYVLPVDGVFGPRTDLVLRSFQASSGLNPTGVVTVNTARFLGLPAACRPRPPPPRPRRPAPPHRRTASPAATAIVGLKLGDHGAAVRRLQTALLGQGFVLSNGADGVFGRSTEHAVALVQRFNQLPQTGVVSSATARALGLGTASPATSTTTTTDAGDAARYVGLTAGATGARVRDLQRALLANGITVRGGADGLFGPATYAALRRRSARPRPRRHRRRRRQHGSACSASASPRPLHRHRRRAGSPLSASTASAVVALQRSLIAAGVVVRGGADGLFGPATATAVGQFQRAHGLTASGRVDAATARALGLAGGPAPATPATPARRHAVGGPGRRRLLVHRHLATGAQRRPRVHLGTDIGAAEGTPVRAVTTGRISYVYVDRPGSLSGNALKVRTAERHLLLLRPPQRLRQRRRRRHARRRWAGDRLRRSHRQRPRSPPALRGPPRRRRRRQPLSDPQSRRRRLLRMTLLPRSVPCLGSDRGTRRAGHVQPPAHAA